MDIAERRAAITAEIREKTGIDDAMIERLVHAFYKKVMEDDVLRPIFEPRIRDWPAHLARMCQFWSSVVLLTGVYHGRPMPAHVRLPVDSVHFDRWLTLFDETARAVCPPPAAALFIDRARRIAESLELGVAQFNGVMLGMNERFRRKAEAPQTA